MIESRLLTPAEVPPDFLPMTFAHYRPLLTNPEPPQLVALPIAATVDGTPAGLILGGMPKSGGAGNPTLFSVFVTPAFRRRGVATHLMRALIDEVARRGGSRIKVIYMGGKSLTPALERLLHITGWETPTPRMAAITADLVLIRALDPPWLRPRRIDTARFRIIPWEEVTDTQKEDLRRWHESDPWIAEDLAPWKHEPGYDRVTSCALLRDGRLVSWVINHLMPDGTTRFTCSFAHPKLQRLGVVLWLYKESVDRAEAHGRRFGSWTVPLYHPAMHAFAQRWMKPCAISCRETYGSQKSLTPWSDSRS